MNEHRPIELELAVEAPFGVFMLIPVLKNRYNYTGIPVGRSGNLTVSSIII